MTLGERKPILSMDSQPCAWQWSLGMTDGKERLAKVRGVIAKGSQQLEGFGVQN